MQHLQGTVYVMPRRTPAASVQFPDFLLCVTPEKIKVNDFPLFLWQRGQGFGKISICEDNPLTACGDCGVATKEEYVEILEFTHFVEFFSFRKIGENHKEKSLVKKVTVVVALDLGTGNTKNLEYENE